MERDQESQEGQRATACLVTYHFDSNLESEVSTNPLPQRASLTPTIYMKCPVKTTDSELVALLNGSNGLDG